MTARVSEGVRPRRNGRIDREKGGRRIEYKRRAGARREPVELGQPPVEQLCSQVCETIGRGYRVNASKEADREQREAALNIRQIHKNKRRAELDICDS